MQVHNSRHTLLKAKRSRAKRINMVLATTLALAAASQQAHSAAEANQASLFGAVSSVNYFSNSADNCASTSVHIDAFAYQNQHNETSTAASRPYAYVYVARYNRCAEQFFSGVAEMTGTSTFDVQLGNLDKGHLTATGTLSVTDWTTFQQRDEQITLDILFSGDGKLETDKTAMAEWIDPYRFNAQFVERLRSSHVSGTIVGRDGLNITLDAANKDSGAAMYVTKERVARNIK